MNINAEGDVVLVSDCPRIFLPTAVTADWIIRQISAHAVTVLITALMTSDFTISQLRRYTYSFIVDYSLYLSYLIACLAAFTPLGSYCSVIIAGREQQNVLGDFNVSRVNIEMRNAQFWAWKYHEKFRYPDAVEYQLYDVLGFYAV